MTDKDLNPEWGRGAHDPYDPNADNSADFTTDSFELPENELPDFYSEDVPSDTEQGFTESFTDVSQTSIGGNIDDPQTGFDDVSVPRMPGAPKDTSLDKNLFGTGIDDYSDEPVHGFTAGQEGFSEPADHTQSDSPVIPPIGEPTVLPTASDSSFDTTESMNDFQAASAQQLPDYDAVNSGIPADEGDHRSFEDTAQAADSTAVIAPIDTEETYDTAVNVEGDGADGDDSEIDDGQDTPKSKKKLIIWIAVIVALIAAIAAATGYYFYYKDRALPGTHVGTINVAGMKAGEIKTVVAKAEKDTQITLTGDLDNVKLHLKDFGAKVDVDKTVENSLKPNKSAWSFVKAIFVSKTVKPTFTIDLMTTHELASTLSENVEDKVDPVEPKVFLEKETGEFKVEEGVQGKGISSRDLEEVTKHALDRLSNTTEEMKVKTIDPFYSVEDMESLAEKANTMATQPISLGVGDDTVVPERPTQATWITLPEYKEKLEPKMNPEAVTGWVNEQAAKISKEAKPGLVYVNEAGKVLLTGQEATDGVKVTNSEDIVKSIVENVEGGTDFSSALETEVDEAPVQRKVIADGAQNLAYLAAPGEKWIDLNVGGRLLTPYVGATQAHSPMPVVPGAPSTPTVRGTFRIHAKVYSQTMRGPGYETPNVRWVSYFHGDYAIHAAWWRSAFGPGTSGGSHGCVNMREGDARWIYEWAPYGTVVKSH